MPEKTTYPPAPSTMARKVRSVWLFLEKICRSATNHMINDFLYARIYTVIYLLLNSHVIPAVAQRNAGIYDVSTTGFPPSRE
jgi:hypothetical protein